MEYIAIKLKTGEDIIGVHMGSNDETIFVSNPAIIKMSMEYGYFIQNWNPILSTETVPVLKKDTMFFGGAATKAIGYHEDFMSKVINDLSDDSIDELEAQFNDLLNSRSSTKH